MSDGKSTDPVPGDIHETTCVAAGFPLVGERSCRREPRRDLAHHPTHCPRGIALAAYPEADPSELPECNGCTSDRDRQSRYCQGFDPDWFVPALLAAEWRSTYYPLEPTFQSFSQWLELVDKLRTEFLGPFDMPERASELKADQLHDVELIRQCCPELAVLPEYCRRKSVSRPFPSRRSREKYDPSTTHPNTVEELGWHLEALEFREGFPDSWRPAPTLLDPETLPGLQQLKSLAQGPLSARRLDELRDHVALLRGWTRERADAASLVEAAEILAHPTETVLARVRTACEQVIRDQAEKGDSARGMTEEAFAARRLGVQGPLTKTDRSAIWVAQLCDELDGEYILPPLDPLWIAASRLRLGPPPELGTPQTGRETLQALGVLQRWIQERASEPRPTVHTLSNPPRELSEAELKAPTHGPGGRERYAELHSVVDEMTRRAARTPAPAPSPPIQNPLVDPDLLADEPNITRDPPAPLLSPQPPGDTADPPLSAADLQIMLQDTGEAQAAAQCNQLLQDLGTAQMTLKLISGGSKEFRNFLLPLWRHGCSLADQGNPPPAIPPDLPTEDEAELYRQALEAWALSQQQQATNPMPDLTEGKGNVLTAGMRQDSSCLSGLPLCAPSSAVQPGDSASDGAAIVQTSGARIQALAAVSLRLIEAIRVTFPVEGIPWLNAGKDQLEAQQQFFGVLPTFARAWYVPFEIPRPGGWRPISPDQHSPAPLRELVAALQQLFDHYGWDVCLNGYLAKTKLCRWYYPDVPLVKTELLDRIESAAKSILGPVPPSKQAGEGAKKAKKRRVRKSEVAELVLSILDDRTYANMNMTELAKAIGRSTSAVSRAFMHEKYGPLIRRKYEQFEIEPPTVDQV
jgi:hypothetical protein